MSKNKMGYEAPATELFVLHLDTGILELSGGTNWSDNPGGAGGNDGYDDGEGF